MQPVNVDMAQASVYLLLRHIGEDPQRDGLRDTPRRVVKAWQEMTCGYQEDPAAILQTTFEQDAATHYGGMVILKGVDFCSLCEHHCLPFVGSAHIVYIPGETGRIVGISKLAAMQPAVLSEAMFGPCFEANELCQRALISEIQAESQ